MTTLVGGIAAGYGVVHLFGVILGLADLGTNLGGEVGNLSLSKRIARIVASALHLIGSFFAGIGLISMGSTMIAIAPRLTFFLAVHQSALVALPYFIGAFSGKISCLILQQLVVHP